MKSFLTFAEALKGKQHKIDADKDGKIEAEDLAKLRAMKKEEVEQIDEVEKATGGLKDACWKGYTAVGMKMKNGKKVPNCVPEETELDEKMNLAKASMGDVIKDFQASDAPQFAGKSKEKRREMAIAAKLEADRGVKEEVEELDEGILSKVAGKIANATGVTPQAVANSTLSAINKKAPGTKMHGHPNFSKFKSEVHAHISSAKNAEEAIRRSSDDHVKSLAKKHFTEEVEQIDELSKSTLGSYVKKASTNARINSMISKDFDHKAMTARKPSTRDAYYGLSSKHKTKAWKRTDNVAKAVDRLTKEEVKSSKPPFDAPYKKTAGDVKDKSGAVHTAASRAKHLAKTGMKKQEPVKEGVIGTLAGGILGGLAGGPLGLAAGAYLGHKAQQAANNAKEVNKKLKKEEVEELDEDKYDRMLSSMLKGKSGERLLKKHSDEVKKTKDIESGKTLNKLVKKNPGVLKTHSAAVKRDKKIYGEEVEQIDELSFNTLASYASKVDQKDKQPLSKKRQAGYNSAAERMSQKAQTADLKNWGKISDSVEYNFDNEGNLMPNPVSFKEFLSQLDEIKMADLPSRKVSGRGYGTEYYKKEAEKDKSGYDDEKKEKSEVKRGRGRPVGSASGARQKGSTTGKKRSGVEMTGYPLHLPNKN